MNPLDAKPSLPPMGDIARLVAAALREDVGGGDRTTAATVPPELVGNARILAKADGVVAGLVLLEFVYDALGGDIAFRFYKADGERVEVGEEIVRFTGSYARLLTGERVALNFLMHLSGIATLTARYVAAVAGTGARILDTRKTLPGLRLLQKYAVRCGGGVNHRLRLDDAMLVKENHAAAAGGIGPAVRAALAAANEIPVVVEVRDLDELKEAVAAGAPALLLDNMTPDEVRRACGVVDQLGKPVEIEVSGGVTLANARAYAEAGAHRLSVGALTHSAPALDLSMLVETAR
jgi:nicotinate-nucleotide pyrophosphorylase (carboxylating)